MKIRTIDSLSVSEIGLGCMNMSAGYGKGDDKESAFTKRSIGCWLHFSRYGAGLRFWSHENLIGKSLESRRNEFILATKCGLSREEGVNGDPAGIIESCEKSLKKLRTDVINLYYLHRVDPNIPIEESTNALAELVKQGKVREIGLSEVCSEI